LKAAEKTQTKRPGDFIALDGPDGCGKSTQCRLLADRLAERGTETSLLRDPGATAIGEKIRRILLDVENAAMGTAAEVLLYMAARAQLWQERIQPDLAKNRCVILDRWVSSTWAYQGLAGGFGCEKVAAIAAASLPRVWPDLTIVLDVDLDTAWKRLDQRLDRMERKTRTYHEHVRRGFLELAGGRRDFAVVDAAGPIESVHEKIIETVRGHFPWRF
jgi:dTMP kinase